MSNDRDARHDARTEALINLASALSADRLEAWDRRLREVDRLLRGANGDEGLVHTVRMLARTVQQHQRVLFGEAGDTGIVRVVAQNREFVEFGKRVAWWLVGFLILNLAGMLTFFGRFIWEAVTGG